MDIFSSASKQIESVVSAPKTHVPMPTREVEISHEIAKSTEEKNQDKQDVSKKLTETVNKLNEQMDSLGTNVQFGFNDKIKTMFVDVVERSTGKPIRKIPSEEAMLLTEKMQEIIGTIFDKKG